MFEFRLGCRFAWLLCRSVFQSLSFLSNLSLSLFLERGRNLTFDLARESLVPHDSFESEEEGRRNERVTRDATRCPGSFHYSRILHYRLSQIFDRRH